MTHPHAHITAPPNVFSVAEHARVTAGTSLVYFDATRDEWIDATSSVDFSIYPLREQNEPSPSRMPAFVVRAQDAGETVRAGRIYLSTDVATLAYVRAIAPRGRGRIAHPKFADAPIVTTTHTARVESPRDDVTTTHTARVQAHPDLKVNMQLLEPPRVQAPRTTHDAAVVTPQTAEALAQLLATLTPNAAPVDLSDVNARIDTLTTEYDRLTRDNESIEIAIKSLRSTIAAVASHAPTRVEVVVNNAEPVNLGVQHFQFPNLLKIVSARLGNGRRVMPWLVGPAGTGKTKAAFAVGEAFGVSAAIIGTLTDAYQVLGYTDAHGKYVRTPFRDAWEHGGVILLDEADRADAHATVALLGGLDSGVMQFPDARVGQHAECVVMAAGNTTGTGATAQFRAAKAQDSAFADRFVFLDWPHDDALESALSTNAAWLRYVRACRVAAHTRKLPEQGFDITTRATLDGQAMLACGAPVDVVIRATVQRRIPATTWAEIASSVTPYVGTW